MRAAKEPLCLVTKARLPIEYMYKDGSEYCMKALIVAHKWMLLENKRKSMDEEK
jgi:hypothetical protein